LIGGPADPVDVRVWRQGDPTGSRPADQWKVERGEVPIGVTRQSDPFALGGESERLQRASLQLQQQQANREAREREEARLAQIAREQAEEARAEQEAQEQARIDAERVQRAQSGGGGGWLGFAGAVLSGVVQGYAASSGGYGGGIGSSGSGGGLSAVQCQQLQQQIAQDRNQRARSVPYASVDSGHAQMVQMMNLAIQSNTDMYNRSCR
jgi:hypothetical protein